MTASEHAPRFVFKLYLFPHPTINYDFILEEASSHRETGELKRNEQRGEGPCYQIRVFVQSEAGVGIFERVSRVLHLAVKNITISFRTSKCRTWTLDEHPLFCATFALFGLGAGLSPNSR